MKVLFYLTIVALCISLAQVDAVTFTCTTTVLPGNNVCSTLINPLLGSPTNYQYFDLTSLSAFNVPVTLGTLAGIFGAIDASALCSQARTNLKQFGCLALYPACASSASVGQVPSMPCNDTNCLALEGSAMPGVFVAGTSTYNAAIATAYSSVLLVYEGLAAGFIDAIVGSFSGSIPVVTYGGCNNLVALNAFLATALSAVVGYNKNEGLQCIVPPVYAVQPTYSTDSCPCMNFPASSNYCLKSENGFTQIPLIYSTSGFNVSVIEAGVQANILAQTAIFAANGLDCPSCDTSLRKYGCSTAFLQCSSTTNAATAMTLPCAPIGQNFVASCSLQQIYGLLTSPLNPSPNATLTNMLATTIAQAGALPTSGCTSQSFTSDANCGCQALSVNDVCSGYVGSVATYIPLVQTNLIAQARMAQLLPLMQLYNISCPTCVNHLTSALCNAIYPACVPALSTLIPHCYSSCKTDLNSCNAQELCNIFLAEGAITNSSCAAYVSTAPAACAAQLLPPAVQPCQTMSSVVATDSVCSQKSLLPASIYPLAQLNPAAAAGFGNINDIQVNLTASGLCANCITAVLEGLCNMKYLSCQTYGPAVTSSITITVPSWGCNTQLNDEFTDCAPITLQTNPLALAAYVAGFSASFLIAGTNMTLASVYDATVLQFNAGAAQLTAVNITYQCSKFHSVKPQPDTCPCVTPTNASIGACSAYVQYPIAAVLDNPYISPQVLGDPNLQGLAGFSCPDCAVKAMEFACLSAFPMCVTNVAGYVPISSDVCENTLTTCRVNQLADPQVTQLLGLVSKIPITPPIVVPDITSFVTACDFLFPAADGIPYAFTPANYTSKPQCPCQNIPASSGCSKYIGYTVVSFLANLPDITRGQLEGVVFGQDTTVNSNCQNCKNAVDQNICSATYPMCTPTAVVVLSCRADCSSSVSFCDDVVDAQAICSGLLSPAFSDNSTTCNHLSNTVTQNCPPSGAGSLIPSFFFVVVALFLALFF